MTLSSYHDAGVDVLGSTEQDAFGVIHGIGKGILSIFGAGAAGDALGKVWQDVGLLKEDAPPQPPAGPPPVDPSQGGGPPPGAPPPPQDGGYVQQQAAIKGTANNVVDVLLLGEVGALAWRLVRLVV